MSLGEKSFFSPFSTLANLFRKPETIRYPQEDLNVHEKPGASMVYRGMHTNDLDKCIGCGTCSTACPTAAITMVPFDREVHDPEKLDERPNIDYGRCCFCAFCVDSCPSTSLNMSRDYIYTSPSVEEEPETEVNWKVDKFTIEPGFEHGQNKGWEATDEISWLDYERVEMEEVEPEVRINSFMEFVKGYSREVAEKEASRCLECGICTNTCPATMAIPEYIRGIFDRDLKFSVTKMYETNPLSAACGRVCTHKCETVCALTHRGEAIAIRWLKRYAIDTLEDEEILKIANAEKKPIKTDGEKISIIGAGPAGLSAGYYLRLMGYDVTIYERMPVAGGTMRYGIPSYRLPDEALEKEIGFIESTGVKIVTNTAVGKDISFEKIQSESKAVLIAVGFPGGRSTRIENHDHKDVGLAILMLNDIRLAKDVRVHKKVVVIGGGNVAMDIARSVARLQKAQHGKVDMILTSLETEEVMPADREEIVEAREEGITILPGWAPKKIELDEKGNIKGLAVARCLSVFDESGRFNPNIDDNDKAFYVGTQVIEAIGQADDYSFLTEDQKKELSIMRGRFPRDGGVSSNIEGIFVAGDILHGPDVIHGINDGHDAARAIDQYLNEKK